MSAAVSIPEAYARCEAITREQAANFHYGIRLLPRERRHAMSAAYAFARRVDDIGDGALGLERKRELLDEQERALAAVESGEPALESDAVMVALRHAYGRFELPPGALGELIEGVRMDLDGVTYEHFDDLVLYCRRVAGAIGRVCLAIFGLRDAGTDRGAAEALADDLGVALQLTNILRDVREDAENGRVYLPAEDLRRFGVISELAAGEVPARIGVLAGALDRPGERRTHAAELAGLSELMRFEAERAQRWFDRGGGLAPLLDRRSAACLLAMAGIYHRLLVRIEADPEGALSRRMSLPAREKAAVALRGMLGGRI